MVGFPETGKSTLLGALWAMIEDPAVPGLQEEFVSGDRSYVQGLAEKLLRGEAVGRTHTDADGSFEAVIGLPDGESVRLTIADRSGEQVRELVEERLWLPELVSIVEAASGLMLFVTALDLNPGLPTHVSSSGAGEEASRAALADYSHRDAATAAKVLDLLENVLEIVSRSDPLPLVVVISAFDVVTGLSPGDWLATRLPALQTFLEANDERLIHSVFGVSAQGGTFPNQAEEVLARGDMHDRCRAWDASGGEVTLIDPLLWLLR